MIKERYCSYELSKLLKEKGFDESIYEFYNSSRTILYARNEDGFRLSELNGIYYPHITHQMAMDWLREKGFYIEIQTLFDEFEPSLLEFTNFHALITTIIDGRVIDETHLADEGIKDYGECVEFAINYCLTDLVKGGEG